MTQFNLSYLLTTLNKLKYSKKILTTLLNEVQPDEEIIVVDGGSTDGTKEYLESLYSAGKIHQFISEPDRCQAHGANKALLMANGAILKILTDDDAFHYPAIEKCKKYMLIHPEVEIVVGNVAYVGHGNNRIPWVFEEGERNFVKWSKFNGKPFWFGDQGLFIRRSSLSLFGLWHTGVYCIDVEKSVMLTSLRQLKIVWFTGIVACSIINSESVTNRPGHNQKSVDSKNKIYDFYTENSDLKRIVKIAERLTKFYLVRKKVLKTVKKLFQKSGKGKIADKRAEGGPKLRDHFSLDDAYDWLKQQNSIKAQEFLD